MTEQSTDKGPMNIREIKQFCNDEIAKLLRLRKEMYPDWRKHTCGECGYFEEGGDGHSPYGCDVLHGRSACPKFVPREVPK